MSQLQHKVLQALQEIDYNGPLLKSIQLQTALEVGQRNKEYTELVQFLTSEIRTLYNLDEKVNAITAPEDAVAFVMEVTSFLKELNCPYNSLTQGLVSERLQSQSERLLLLDYLISQLMAARILQERKPEKKKIELKLQETPEAADMRQILQTLRFPKPPANITIKQLFDKLDTTIPLVIKKAGADLIGKSLFTGTLSQEQWETLRGVQTDLHNEYKIRREMLLTRLDVTIQSFQWSDRTKGKEADFEKIYHDNRKLLHVKPKVDISHLLAARTDLAIVEKTSNATVTRNTQSNLNKVMIGEVPDRGGRSWEQTPPPPEMPSWQQNRTPTAGQPIPVRAGRGGRGGYRNDNRSQDHGQTSGYQGRNVQNSTRGDFDNQRRYSAGNPYDNNRGQNYYENQGGSRGGGYNNYNRRDSYGQEYQQNKRPKTYDNFQANKTTYADQYVQENQHNQQYQRGGGGGRGFQRGRSNYHRGGYR